MVTPALLLMALLSVGQPTGHDAVELRPVRAPSHELLPPHDAPRERIRLEAVEDREEDGEDEALPSGFCRAIDESGPPPYLIHLHPAPLHPSTESRHRPLRGPPTP
jgi:hypothetical protein